MQKNCNQSYLVKINLNKSIGMFRKCLSSELIGFDNMNIKCESKIATINIFSCRKSVIKLIHYDINFVAFIMLYNVSYTNDIYKEINIRYPFWSKHNAH